MRIHKNTNTVSFEYSDMPFVRRHGILEATEMVLNFAVQCDLPFLYDTHQLAHHLGLTHKELHRLTGECDRLYRPITLKKKRGGNRYIHAPLAPLSNVQRRILDTILNKLPISPYATAYHQGGKLIDNAAPHGGKRYLLKLDLKDFFGSIRFDQVYIAAFNAHYFPRQIGAMLTALCCREDVLPQGTPTSPALSNLVMRHFDDVMGGWCGRQGLSYTRYCDDITISGDRSLYTAYTKAKKMLENMGFTLNEKKTHFFTNGNRQTVTGLTVNNQPHVPREYRRALRQELHYVLKFGAADAILRGDHFDFIRNGQPDTLRYLDHLEGRIQYVLQIHPNDTALQKAYHQLRVLRGQEKFTAAEYTPYFPAAYDSIGSGQKENAP